MEPRQFHGNLETASNQTALFLNYSHISVTLKLAIHIDFILIKTVYFVERNFNVILYHLQV